MQVQEIKTFYTSFYTVNIETGINIEQIAKSLESSGGESKNSSSFGGWRSEAQNYESIIYIQPFLDKLINLMDKIYNEFNISKKAEISNYWFNINRTNNFNWLHNHPQSFFSAIFCIKSVENSGNLIFERPDLLTSTISTSKLNEKNSNSVTFRPKPNDLIIFPSHLKHKVEPNRTNEDYISIVFNFK